MHLRSWLAKFDIHIHFAWT